jgi:hypothetical protein
VFYDPRGLGGTAVSIAGIRGVERVVFKGNVLNGRGLNLGNTARTIVEGNVIVQRGRLAAVALVKRNDEVMMTSNYVTREQTGDVPNTTPLVLAEHHNSGMPGRLTFSANHFVADGQGVAIDLRSALSVLMASNVIEGNGPDAVRIYGSARQMESAIVASNLFRGAFGRALDIGGVLRVSLTGNVAPSAVDSILIGGVRCGVIGQIVMSGNLWGASTCGTP